MESDYFMNKDQLLMLNDVEQIQEYLLTSFDLSNQNDRTLLYGYDVDRNTWHIYLYRSQIYAVMYYLQDGEVSEMKVAVNDDYVPNKRLYPERCDFEFCKLLKRYKVSLPFTNWSDGVEAKVYYGKLLPRHSK